MLPRRIANPGASRVLCVSLPKAGTHLLERAICLHPKLYRKIMPTVSSANIARWGGFEGLLGRLRPGQVVVSHLHFRAEYADALARRGVRSLFLVRDPRAVVVSQSHYVVQRSDHRLHEAFVGLSEPERLRLAIVGDPRIDMPSIADRLASFCGWLDSDALTVRFEDLVGPAGGGDATTQEETVSAIYRHLGLRADDALVRSVCARLFSTNSPTFRTGSIDGWRRAFDPTLEALFAETVGDGAVPYGYDLLKEG